MNSFAITTLIALCLLLNNQPPQSPWEKRVVADTQHTLASDLDAELPRLSFRDWFEKVVRQRAGVIWQLSECGKVAGTSSNATEDVRACVEVNTILHDGRRVIVMVTVGTFKKGVTGAPAFQFGVIEKKGKLLPIPRLRDLPRLLSAPESVTSRPAVKLPDDNTPKVKLAPNNVNMAGPPAWSGEEFGRSMVIEEPSPPPPPPPPLRAELAPPTTTPTAENRPESGDSGQAAPSEDVKLLGSISWGDVIKKAQPRYPARAKRVNASGPVKVQITIAENGHVIVAKAISGHPLLRDAAEEAARQWVFKPAVLNGAQVKTETVLVFIFTAPQ